MATTPQGARLAGAKAPSYVRAVNEVEARSSGYTARYMLTSDVAYVLTAAEMNLTPAESAKPLLEALLALIDDLDAIDTTTPAGDIVAQREAWMREKVGAQHAAWLHLGRNRGESLRAYLPRLYFRHVLYEQRRTVAGMLRVLVEKAGPFLRRWRPTTIIFNIPALARWASICSRGCRCSFPIWNGWSRWSSVWTMARRSSVRARRCTRCMTR